MHKTMKHRLLKSLLLSAVVFSMTLSTITAQSAQNRYDFRSASVSVNTNMEASLNLIGSWYYTALIDENGKVTKMSNRESYIRFKKNGDYEQTFGSARSIIGTFTTDDTHLTLHPENTEPRTYTMTFDGNETLTLKAASGAGYVLERGNN